MYIWVCVSFNRAVRKGREMSQWSRQNNTQSVAPFQGSVCRKSLCVCVCVCVRVPSGTECVSVFMSCRIRVCVWVGSHAAVCTQHLPPLPLCKLRSETEKAFLQGDRVLLVTKHVSRGNGVVVGTRKIPPDFKIIKGKSRPLYCMQAGLRLNLQLKK